MNNCSIRSFFTSNRAEYHVSIRPDASAASFGDQLDSALASYEKLLGDLCLESRDLFFTAVFTSDLINQKDLIEKHTLFAGCLKSAAVSVTEQPPLDGSKINLLLWFVKSADRCTEHYGGMVGMKINGCLHLFHFVAPGETCGGASVEEQTFNAFALHDRRVAAHGMSLASNCLRTWIYVKDIDCDYAAMAAGRNRYFSDAGLTPDTHFIASTGIGGGGASPDGRLALSFYSVGGLREGAVRYLKATGYMNPTYEYGIAFERGTRISWGEGCTVFISGTASIDALGRCVHEGAVIEQIDRVFVNIGKLLEDAGASLLDIMQMTVYLRDTADAAAVRKYIAGRFADVPCVIVLGRVCRPAWLAEVECVAAMRDREG
jgi:enamine deaminase RidA (YjgF/YER057c/UK114 family)